MNGAQLRDVRLWVMLGLLILQGFVPAIAAACKLDHDLADKLSLGITFAIGKLGMDLPSTRLPDATPAIINKAA